VLYFAFEESAAQIMRNMQSIGLNLQQWSDKGLLRFHATRPTLYGLEMHLAIMHKMINEFRPRLVIVDPISNFTAAASVADAHSMLLRLVDYLKMQGITAFFTALTSGGNAWEMTDVGISSIVDSWILLRDIELGGERNRGIYVLKSRGMAHSNQIREFLLTSSGIQLQDVYVGPEGVLTGSMRVAQEARERARLAEVQREIESRRRVTEQKRKAIEAQIAALQAELASQQQEESQLLADKKALSDASEMDRQSMARSRKAFAKGGE
jgi:circadian clock protein KaiC